MSLARGRWREVGVLAGVLVVVVAGSVGAQARQVPAQTPLDVVGYGLLIGVVVVLPGRRRWPRSVFTAAVVIIGGYLLLAYPYGPIVLAASVAVFALASVDSPRASVVAVMGGVVLWIAALAPHLVPSGGWSSLVGAGAAFAAWLIIPAWWAMVRGRQRDAAMALVEQRRRELGEQRLELAREVHDVVAHNLTVIGVQAAAALRVFDRDPQRARDALGAIAATNRQSLAQLRDTVELLASPNPGGGRGDRRAPTGGLAELPSLIESARSTGAAVELHLDSSPDGPPDGTVGAPVAPLVERTAYRIVQESLTNAMRHAPGAAVTVAVEQDGDRLVIRVHDRGPGLCGRQEGRGIVGMRERAAAAGGALDITSDPGGLTVCAQLPVNGGTR